MPELKLNLIRQLVYLPLQLNQLSLFLLQKSSRHQDLVAEWQQLGLGNCTIPIRKNILLLAGLFRG